MLFRVPKYCCVKMVNCAVFACKRRSATSNLREHGISYHKFPKDPTLRELWTKCCGQKISWKVTRTSVICSEHFTPERFEKLASNKRKLVVGAIPTLRSCQCMENVKSLNNIGVISPSNVSSPGQHSKKDSTANIHDESKLLKTSLANTTRMKKLKSQLLIKNKKIHRLQAKTRYLKKKVDTLKELLQELD